MNWRDWKLPVLFVLLLYHMLRLSVFWPPEQPLPAMSPTLTPSPAAAPDRGREPSSEVQAVAPTFTPFPSRTPTTAPTVEYTPQPLATIPVAGAPSTAESNSAYATPTNTPTSSATPVAPSGSQTIAHTVQSGETLSGIAAQYGVSVQAIVESNDLENPDAISIGQVLTIVILPPPPSTSTPPP